MASSRLLEPSWSVPRGSSSLPRAFLEAPRGFLDDFNSSSRLPRGIIQFLDVPRASSRLVCSSRPPRGFLEGPWSSSSSSRLPRGFLEAKNFLEASSRGIRLPRGFLEAPRGGGTFGNQPPATGTLARASPPICACERARWRKPTDLYASGFVADLHTQMEL